MSEKMQILLAYDGSSGADAALDDLLHAGFPPIAEALILCVAEVVLPPSSPPKPEMSARAPVAVQRAWARATQALEEARALAHQGQARVLSSFPGWEVSAEACADAPAWAVVKRAAAWKPDVIVVGSDGRSAVGRFFLGSVSQKILAEAHCSVRVGRRSRHAAAAPLHLLIGVDGSPDAAAAVRVVAAREWPQGSEVHLVSALDATLSTTVAFTHLPAVAGTEAGAEEVSSWLSKTVDAMAATLRARGLTVSSIITEGDPKRVLVDEAERWGADCIIVGARGLAGMKRFLLGSVSATVAARAHCSVEVVRE